MFEKIHHSYYLVFAIVVFLDFKEGSLVCDRFHSSQLLKKFDGKLKDQLSKRYGNESYVYSPYGLLSLVHKMVQMLEPENQEDVRAALGVRKEAHLCPPIPTESNPEFSEASRIWIDASTQLDKKFLSKNTTDLESLKMQSNPSVATNLINTWVTNKTMGMIRTLLKPGVITKDTNLVVTNALAFHGKWKFPFKTEHTEPRDFKINKNQKIKVPTMVTTVKTRFHRDPERGEIAELPYAGAHYSMFIILPSSANGKKGFTEKELEDVVKNQMKRHVKLEVFLPKFKLTSGFEMHDLLVKIGFSSLFKHVAVIKKPGDVSFTDVIHKVSLVVNEEGTKASAGSAGVTSRSFPMRFRVNEPFEFLIRDLKQEKNIFHGHVIKPEYDG